MSCFDLFMWMCLYVMYNVYTIKLNYSKKHDRIELEENHECIDRFTWDAAMHG